MPRFILAHLLAASALTVGCSGDKTIVLGVIGSENIPAETPSAGGAGGSTTATGTAGEEAAGGAPPLPAPENLLTNGDFAEGAVGLQTGYSLVEVARVSDGEIAVTNEPHVLHPKVLVDVEDVSGEGMMLMVNGATTADVPIFQQTISVEQGQSYRFSIWARLWSVGEHFPILELRLDGLKVSELTENVVLTGDAWAEMSFEWEATASGPLILSMVNANLEGISNDFFLDSATAYQLPH